MEFLTKNLSYLLAGISVGGQYALIAIGYTMVYGILRLINFAHGDVFMVAGLMMPSCQFCLIQLYYILIHLVNTFRIYIRRFLPNSRLTHQALSLIHI